MVHSSHPPTPAPPTLCSAAEFHLGPPLEKGIQDGLNVTCISTPHLLNHLISARENILCTEVEMLTQGGGGGHQRPRGPRGVNPPPRDRGPLFGKFRESKDKKDSTGPYMWSPKTQTQAETSMSQSYKNNNQNLLSPNRRYALKKQSGKILKKCV